MSGIKILLLVALIGFVAVLQVLAGAGAPLQPCRHLKYSEESCNSCCQKADFGGGEPSWELFDLNVCDCWGYTKPYEYDRDWPRQA